MLQRFIFIAKYFSFWLLFFICLKILFLAYFIGLPENKLELWPSIISHGLRLDLSATAYLSLFVILLIIPTIWFKGRWFSLISKIYTIVLLSIFSAMAVTDLISYTDWGNRIDASSLFYLSKPKEAIASVSLGFILLHILIFTVWLIAFIFLYNRVFRIYSRLTTTKWWAGILYLLLFGFMILPIRGGIGTAPINIGSAYFSSISFNNHAAINLPWNMGYSFTNLETVENPYNFMDQNKAVDFASGFTKYSSDYKQVLSSSQPNIILVILESFTANVMGSLGAEIPVTPNLDSIASKGILFSNFYASGSRTDKGMLAILSAYPAQPTTSIIKFPNKTQKLASLPRSLKELGYSTEFYYGGDIEFANYQSFLLNAGYEKLVSQKDFPSDQSISSWGVPDEFLFERAYESISRSDQPYFKTLFTLSSHPPFDIPMEPYLKGSSNDILFSNSVYYTDYHLGKFVEKLETNGNLENTLLIFVADHGSTWPGNLKNFVPEKFHIPMVWYGDVLIQSGIIDSTYANQTDIAPSLLTQLGKDANEYKFGKNIFSMEQEQQVIYTFNNGFGYISDSLVYYYQRIPNKPSIIKGILSDEKLLEGKAYMQVLYEDLIGL